MEWNAKSPSLWEWENLINFSAKPTEISRKLQLADWTIDEMRGDSGSFYSSEGGPGGSPGSDFGCTSSTKSSKSASICSSIGEANTFRPPNVGTESVVEGFCTKNEFAKIKQVDTSPSFEASVGSGDPFLSLKLGKGTEFGDASGRNSAKSSNFSVVPLPTTSPAKRSKSSSLSANLPCCQVEGCNLDLSLAKDYHRKHRVCESHSKCSKVIIGGLERRFCQQCSRFHSLLEFDEKKRSCRKRLSDHNARRRKPQAETAKLNSANLYSSFSDVRRHISFGWNKGPSFPSKPSMNIMWGTTGNPVFMQTNEYMAKPVKMESTNGLLNQSSNGRSNITAMMHHDSSGFYPSKCTSTEVPNQGLSPVSSNLDSAQEFHRALSLLSNSSRSSCEPKHVSLDQAMNATPFSMHQPMVHTISPISPIPPSDFWQCERPGPEVPAFASQNLCNSHYQEFQQLRSPNEGADYSCQFD